MLNDGVVMGSEADLESLSGQTEVQNAGQSASLLIIDYGVVKVWGVHIHK